ncbi:hypothetical protein [Micromonospora cathayae]|uniref:Uncharacterized protein n=1 Tax=Micromonospora cathayae TaxID=3028804 RepID=A0ABY7ZZS2_9ACTN|nr:hypothetical protein [Micromonospora sp. HUAS 3]WDZ87249.1 hypothetical protein PVK37_12990 [Micromonospora sp. HUAS 3]
MVAHLVGADDLGVQEGGQRFVDAVPSSECACGLDGLSDLPFDRKCGGVEQWFRLEGPGLRHSGPLRLKQHQLPTC